MTLYCKFMRQPGLIRDFDCKLIQTYENTTNVTVMIKINQSKGLKVWKIDKIGECYGVDSWNFHVAQVKENIWLQKTHTGFYL